MAPLVVTVQSEPPSSAGRYAAPTPKAVLSLVAFIGGVFSLAACAFALALFALAPLTGEAQAAAAHSSQKAISARAPAIGD